MQFYALFQWLPISLSLIFLFFKLLLSLTVFFPVCTSCWHNSTSLNHFSGECWLWLLDLWNYFRHSLSIYIPFPQCAEKISSPPVKPLGVELNKLDYPLMSAYSVMNTGTRTPPVLCHSHYSYTGQNYFDINLVGDRVNCLLIKEVKVRILIRPKSFHIWNKLNKKIITLRRKFF